MLLAKTTSDHAGATEWIKCPFLFPRSHCAALINGENKRARETITQVNKDATLLSLAHSYFPNFILANHSLLTASSLPCRPRDRRSAYERSTYAIHESLTVT